MKIIIKFLLKFLKIIIDEIYFAFGAFCFFVIIFAFIVIINYPYLIDVINWFLLPDHYKISLKDLYKISIEYLYENSTEDFSQYIGINEKQKAQEIHYQFIRNFGWALWVVISLSGLGYGLYLATKGRKTQEKLWKTQHDSHLHDRYEKAANMLGSGIMAVRVAGCRALRSLGKDDKSMKVQCVRLLFSFIRNPYLEDKDKDKKLDEVFPINKVLRDDIQESADSVSAIYKYYSNKGISGGKITLPNYFLYNTKKKPISLIGANLEIINCERVYLPRAKLQRVKLKRAKLQNANLQNANLQNAILIGVDLQGAKLRDADLQEAEMRGAELREAKLINADLQKTNLEHANMQGAEMWGANLRKANLMNAKLQRVILFRANMQEVNLRDANMQEADISNADLRRADLWDVNFDNANITDTDMREVKNLTKKQVLSAVWGYDELGLGGPPDLSKELENDPELRSWLAAPHFNKE